MNIYLDNKIINDVTMSDAEISVYVALRSLYASNRKAQYISYNMLMYELFGNSDYNVLLQIVLNLLLIAWLRKDILLL